MDYSVPLQGKTKKSTLDYGVCEEALVQVSSKLSPANTSFEVKLLTPIQVTLSGTNITNGNAVGGDFYSADRKSTRLNSSHT